jgi:hypothetical protein
MQCRIGAHRLAEVLARSGQRQIAVRESHHHGPFAHG